MMIDSDKLMGREQKDSIILSEKNISNLGVVRKRLIDIDGMLKEQLVLSKVREGIRRQEEERLKRLEREKEIEDDDPDDDPDGDKPDSKSKKKSDGILVGLGSLITGGILNFVRKNFRAFSVAAKILAGVGKVAAFLFKRLSSAINLGYSAITAIDNSVLKYFGENGLKTLQQFQKVFSRFVNVAIITAAVSAGGNLFGRKLFNKVRGKLKGVNIESIVKRISRVQQNVVKGAQRISDFAKVKTTQAADVIKGAGDVIGSKVTQAKGVVQGTVTSAQKKSASFIANQQKFARISRKVASRTIAKTGKVGLVAAIMPYRKTISKIFGKVPIIGALLDFAVNYYLLGMAPQKAAFVAAISGIAGAIGGIAGTIVGGPIGGFLAGVGASILADKAGSFLYDRIILNRAKSALKASKLQERALENLINDFDAFEDMDKAFKKNEELIKNLRQKRKQFGFLEKAERAQLNAALKRTDELLDFRSVLNVDLQRSIRDAIEGGLLKDFPVEVLDDVQRYLTSQIEQGLGGTIINFEEASKRIKNIQRMQGFTKPVKKFIQRFRFDKVAMAGGGEVPDIGFSAFYDDPMVGSVQFIPIPISTPSKTSESNSLIAMSSASRIRQTQSSLYAGGLS
tara:strand:- start:651 stop:2528 length:1878 start_codon:yes stop_codon:yes gene_type:complete